MHGSFSTSPDTTSDCFAVVPRLQRRRRGTFSWYHLYVARVRYIIGIDEAGRGPLAGPVSVAALMVPRNFDMEFFKDIRDSKRLSAQGREEWYAKIRQAAKDHVLFVAASFVGHATIDDRGIVSAVFIATSRVLSRLPASPHHCRVLLDGGMRAPQAFLYQETIIGGDEQEPLIAAASIVAKVRRDRRMKRLAELFPQYGFEAHNGYGTAKHQRAIRRYGLCDIHRTTFCRV